MRVKKTAAVIAGLAVAALAGSLTACTGSDDAPSSSAAPVSVAAGDGILDLVALLPGTGEGSEFGFATETGVQLAVRDIEVADLGPGLAVTVLNTGAMADGIELPDESIDAIVGPFSGTALTADVPLASRSADAAPATPSDAFVTRLLTVTPQGLSEYGYAAEAYDAVIVFALAALITGSDSAEAVGVGLPLVFDGDYSCTAFGDCATAIRDGQTISYIGQSGVAGISATPEASITLGGTSYSAGSAISTTP